MIKNHVQFLHLYDGQILHSPEVQILPSGGLNAFFTCWPGIFFCIPAYMQILPSGLNANIAYGPGGRSCLQAMVQKVQLGLKANFACWQALK